MTAKVRLILEELKQRLGQTYGDRLARVMLFGSQARGDARPDSDIDVLVVLRGEVDPEEELFRTSHDLAGICLAHDTLICCFSRSESASEAPREPFLKDIIREGISV